MLHANVTYCINISVPDGLINLVVTDELDGGAILVRTSEGNVTGKLDTVKLEDWSVEGICRSCPRSTMLRADVTYGEGSQLTVIVDSKLAEETCFLSMARRRLVCRTSITKTVEL